MDGSHNSSSISTIDEHPQKLREEEAEEYVVEHKLIELFTSLTELLVYHQPADPRSFVINIIEKIMSARRSRNLEDLPSLFHQEDVETIFGMLDPTQRGHVTLIQYQEALKSIGAIGFNEYPFVTNEVRLDLFKSQALAGLKMAAATYADQEVSEDSMTSESPEIPRFSIQTDILTRDGRSVFNPIRFNEIQEEMLMVESLNELDILR